MKYDIGYKYRILYELYKKLYGFVLLDKKNRKKWIVYEDIEEGDCIAELKESKNLGINERIVLHYKEYKRLKREFKDVNIMLNGRVSLF